MAMNEAYPDSKKSQDRLVSPYIYWVLRPVSFGLSRWLVNLGISAMQCTAVSALVLVAGMFLMMGGPATGLSPYISMLLGALLVNVYLYLDVVDGNMARISGSSSSAGELADSIVNVLAGFAVPVAVGVGVYWHGGGFITDAGLLTRELALVMGLVIGYSRLFRRVVYDKVNNLTGGNRLSILGDRQLSGNVSVFAYIASVVNSLVFPALVIVSALNIVALWLATYFLFNLLVVIYVLVSGFRKLSIRHS